MTEFMELLELQGKAEFDEEAREYVHLALEGASRMQMLIKDLLEFTRAGGGSLSRAPADLGALLDDALKNFDVGIKGSGAIVTHDPLPRVAVDAGLLTLVFQNLISNSLKYRSEQRPEVHVGVERQPDALVVSVRDNGIGISGRAVLTVRTTRACPGSRFSPVPPDPRQPLLFNRLEQGAQFPSDKGLTRYSSAPSSRAVRRSASADELVNTSTGMSLNASYPLAEPATRVPTVQAGSGPGVSNRAIAPPVALPQALQDAFNGRSDPRTVGVCNLRRGQGHVKVVTKIANSGLLHTS